MRLLSPLGKGRIDFGEIKFLTRNTIAGRTEYKVTVVGYHHSNTFIAGLSTCRLWQQHHSAAASQQKPECMDSSMHSGFSFLIFFSISSLSRAMILP